MKKRTLFLLFIGSLILWFMFWIEASGQSIEELNNTGTNNTVATLAQLKDQLRITSISFNSSDNDWVRFEYMSLNNNHVNLKGISFSDDKTFKTIEQDFWIAAGQEVQLTFNKSEKDNSPYLFTDRKGLTATTEQFIISAPEGTIIDAFCWVSKTPAQTELKDFEKLNQQQAWSADITSCFDSEAIKKDTIIARKKGQDSNSKNDWEIKTAQVTGTQTPPPQDPKVIPLEEIKTSGRGQKAKTSKKSSSPTYSNGDPNGKIIISEILPNPQGTDTGNEWIELFNKDEKTIHLGNWQIDDGEKGGKVYKIPDNINIEPGKTVLLSSKETKIALGNKTDTIHLLNPSGETIDTLEYHEAADGKSYSLITTKVGNEENEEWLWVNDTTPNEPNPIYTSFTIKVMSEAIFGGEYTFQAKIADGQIITIVFDESVVPGPLAKASFTPGTEVLVTGILMENLNENELELKKYEVLTTAINTSTHQISTPNTILIIIITVLSGGGIWLWLKIKRIKEI